MHLLGGRALNSGYRLYDSFVDLHGPCIFMLAQDWEAAFGWSHSNLARLVSGRVDDAVRCCRGNISGNIRPFSALLGGGPIFWPCRHSVAGSDYISLVYDAGSDRLYSSDISGLVCRHIFGLARLLHTHKSPLPCCSVLPGSYRIYDEASAT